LETGTIRALAGITNTASGSIIGNGTLSGNVTSAGSISPGLSLGTLTFSGNLTLPGIYAADLDGTGSGSADTIIVAGQLDLTGGTLLITTNSPLDDTAYLIASYGSLVGTFATVSGLPSPYYVDYNYLGGQQIAVVIPEPSTVFLVGSGLVLGVLVWRRRRRRSLGA
jgi:hypothetical protein